MAYHERVRSGPGKNEFDAGCEFRVTGSKRFFSQPCNS
jgi:hypothetical protein